MKILVKIFLWISIIALLAVIFGLIYSYILLNYEIAEETNSLLKIILLLKVIFVYVLSNIIVFLLIIRYINKKKNPTKEQSNQQIS